MTAYSRSSLMTKWGLLTIEVQSLNRRHLEVNSSLPKEFLFFDPLIKKEVQKKLFRGKINIYLNFSYNEEAEVFKLSPNLSLAMEIKKGWDTLSERLKIKEKEAGFIQLLCKESSLFQSEFKSDFLDEAKENVQNLLEKAIDQLLKMREQEGLFLKEELIKGIATIEELLKKVRELVKSTAKERHQKLKDRLSEILEKPIESDERLLKELALLADKSDLTEEVTRVASHLKLFKQVIGEKKKSVGKTLDFISQELNREWNTIGSKCIDIQTSHLVIEAKGECEKIREQVQNIE